MLQQNSNNYFIESFTSDMLRDMKHSQDSLLIRSSRKRLHEHSSSQLSMNSQQDAECDIEEFKEQIQQKFQDSVANKLYSFPYTLSILDDESDASLQQLQQMSIYMLYEQPQRAINKFLNNNKFTKVKSKTDKYKTLFAANPVENLQGLKRQLNGYWELVGNTFKSRIEKHKSQEKITKKNSTEKPKDPRYGTVQSTETFQSKLRIATEPDEVHIKLKIKRK